MRTGRVGEQGDIEVDTRVIHEQARQTIRRITDAAVELVTNSDDSYRRMDMVGGQINISVTRLSRGRWDVLEVEDKAEGMTLDALLDALRYGTRSSGFARGLSVRGLWGRGMKETVIALGQGEIQSIRDRRQSAIKVWWDQGGQRARWEIIADQQSQATNGTIVTIHPDPETEVRCPEFNSLYEQLSSHYALRGIVQSRDVWLDVKSSGGRGRYSGRTRNHKRLEFKEPEGTLVLEKDLPETSFGPSHLAVFESRSPLSFNRWDPCSLAGLLIKTGDIPLDNSLFGFEDEVGRYFFGAVDCPQLSDEIRKEPAILTTNRTGIDWRQGICREFEQLIQKILDPLIKRKRAELTSKTAPTISNVYKSRLLRMLNKLAEEELETSTTSDGPGPGPALEEIQKLTIKPDEGSAPPGQPRRFSIYVPEGAARAGASVQVDLLERSGEIDFKDSSVVLAEHPNVQGLLWGHFDVAGAELGNSTWVRGSFHGQDDVAYFEVKFAKQRRKVGPGASTGGFFKDIKPNSDPDPQQRVAYVDGAIVYFVEFPVVRDYVLGERLNEADGKVLFAEMVAEAVCGALARKRIENGLVPGRPNEDSTTTVDRYLAEVNRIRKKCLPTVHKWAETYTVVTGVADQPA